MKIILATRNTGKISEIRKILSDVDIEFLDFYDLPPFPEPSEEGESFLDNALLKAKAVSAVAGLPALADDSGLEVEALDGGPGVHSARFGGEGLSDRERAMKLLEALQGVPDDERGARFRCVMVLFPAPGREEQTFVTEGILYGRIAFEPAGENGFGYDPIFLVPERRMTLAQMASEEKNSISHRYRALVEMKWLLVRECNLKLKKS